MVKPDVIVCWPRNCDYPLWRAFIERERERFAQVIVVFTDHDGHDYSGWVRESMPGVLFLDSPERGDRDWRDVAVNHALDNSSARWVWFTEQDFILTDPERFWACFGWATGFRDETRWHPASLLLPRDLIDRTSRYFGPDPVDHFVTFSRELDAMTRTIAHWPPVYEHLQGLSQNHYLVEQDIAEGVFKRERFRAYLRACLRADVPLHPRWAADARRIA